MGWILADSIPAKKVSLFKDVENLAVRSINVSKCSVMNMGGGSDDPTSYTVEQKSMFCPFGNRRHGRGQTRADVAAPVVPYALKIVAIA
jgi:hypothetical protein